MSDLQETLKRLNTQIKEAEKYLRKLPGSSLPQTYIETRIGPVCYDHSTKFISIVGSNSTVPISNLNIKERIEVASKIPDLIYLAKKGEEVIAKKAKEIGEEIEHAIATVIEETEASWREEE